MLPADYTRCMGLMPLCPQREQCARHCDIPDNAKMSWVRNLNPAKDAECLYFIPSQRTGGPARMINIDSNQGRIGEFWWINSDPSSIHQVDVPIAANIQVDLVLWGSCGIGRNVHVVMAPAHD